MRAVFVDANAALRALAEAIGPATLPQLELAFGDADIVPDALPAALAGAEALGTVIYVGDNAGALLQPAREASAGEGCRMGSTLVNGVLLTRFLGDAVAVRGAVVAFLGFMRHAAGGLPQALPKVCYN